MDKNEALLHWLQQAFKAGEISVRLERAIEGGQVTLSEALRILDGVLEQAAMIEVAGPPRRPFDFRPGHPA